MTPEPVPEPPPPYRFRDGFGSVEDKADISAGSFISVAAAVELRLLVIDRRIFDVGTTSGQPSSPPPASAVKASPTVTDPEENGPMCAAPPPAASAVAVLV